MPFKIYRSSVAVDLNNVDQTLSGVDPQLITSARVLWDLNEDFDIQNSDFIVPIDGVYNFNGQFKFKNFVNCKSIEIAIYKRNEIEDDYWFILDKRSVDEGDTQLQLSNATGFDMYEAERFCLKVILEKVDPGLDVTAELDGSDDYTAWEFTISQPL